MKPGQDPRPDQQRTGKDAYPDPPTNSIPKPAPGGVGTGTKDDPAQNR